jgi:hypothetical protein
MKIVTRLIFLINSFFENEITSWGIYYLALLGEYIATIPELTSTDFSRTLLQNHYPNIVIIKTRETAKNLKLLWRALISNPERGCDFQQFKGYLLTGIKVFVDSKSERFDAKINTTVETAFGCYIAIYHSRSMNITEFLNNEFCLENDVPPSSFQQDDSNRSYFNSELWYSEKKYTWQQVPKEKPPPNQVVDHEIDQFWLNLNEKRYHQADVRKVEAICNDLKHSILNNSNITGNKPQLSILNIVLQFAVRILFMRTLFRNNEGRFYLRLQVLINDNMRLFYFYRIGIAAELCELLPKKLATAVAYFAGHKNQSKKLWGIRPIFQVSSISHRDMEAKKRKYNDFITKIDVEGQARDLTFAGSRIR